MKRRTFLQTVGGAAGALALGSEWTQAKSAQDMPRRVLGRTGWEVSVIPFSGLALTRDEQDVCTAAVHTALDQGVNYLDVAPAYGNGVCENRLGVALDGVDRSTYYLACKTGARDGEGARKELERSLKRLKTDHFDLYQLHHLVRLDDVKEVFGPGGAMETIQAAHKEGKIRAVGFSAHTTPAALEAMKQFKFDTVMFPINYVEYFNLGFGKEVLELAADQGAAVLSIKTMNSGSWPRDAQRARPWWYRTLESQDDINLAYRWTLSLPGVVMGFPPAWLDLQEKAIKAGYALRPVAETDAERLRVMAKLCGSIFERERAQVARGYPLDVPYPFHPERPCITLA